MSQIIQINDTSKNIRKNPEFDVSKITKSDYIKSLIDEAERSHAIDSDTVTKIYSSVMDALAALIEQKTSGESYSVTEDTASQLIGTIIANAGEYLISLGDDYYALETLINNDMLELYKLGLLNMRKLLLECVNMLVKIKKTRISLPNRDYNSSIDNKISAAIKNVDEKYCSHIVSLSGMYTPSKRVAARCAPLKIMLYEHYLYYENIFCSHFGKGTELIYYTYCENFAENPAFAHVNIYKLVLKNATGAVLAGKNPGTLSIDNSDCEKIYDKFSNISPDEFSGLVLSALDKIRFGNLKYNRDVMEADIPYIKNAVQNRSLDGYLLLM